MNDVSSYLLRPVSKCAFPGLILLIVLACSVQAFPANHFPRSQSLNGSWKLWFDSNADWQHEKLILNPKSLGDIPTYPPTIGWDEMLKKGETYRVPATWDEFYPHRHGVGWYWRTVHIPSAAQGMTIHLRFAAVRLRAEVYWNRRLVGYSVEGFTPFRVDVTRGARYGEDNLLAVRVTNPGGGSSWMDFNPISWGDVHLPDSHDFGGIWQDVDLLIVPPMHIQDVYAAPREDLETLRVTTEVANAGSQARKALLAYEVYAPGGLRPVATGIQLEDPTLTLGKYFEARTIFYPDLASPSYAWQPVLLVYNPEGSDYSSRFWSAAGLTEEVSVRGRTALLWATDTTHGKTVTEVLQKLHVLPDDSQVLPLGLHWFGGWEFNTPHPIFAGLPAPVIFDQYFASAFAYWGITHFPDKMIAGLLNAPPQLAVTLGELPFGKGKILVCSMNLLPYLDKDPVADRILAQMLNYAVKTADASSEQLRCEAAGKCKRQ